MDVRAADTSSLAAKRLEMENVQPVKDRRGFMQETSRKTGDRVSKAKHQKEQHGHQEGCSGEHSDSEDDAFTSEQTHAVSGEEHILDVKV